MGSLNEHIATRKDIIVGNTPIGHDYCGDSILSFNINTFLPKQTETAYRKQNGEYGICVDCRKQIPPERLEVVPNATRCITCQSKTEEGHAS